MCLEATTQGGQGSSWAVASEDDEKYNSIKCGMQFLLDSDQYLRCNLCNYMITEIKIAKAGYDNLMCSKYSVREN